MAIASLCTRLDRSDVEYCKKLNRFIIWLQKTINDVRIIGWDNFYILFTWIDAYYAVWDKMSNQTGGYMPMWWVMIHAKSVERRHNTNI